MIQKITKTYTTTFDKAYCYYKLVTAVNNIDLTERELQLITFIALKGNLYSAGNREEFIHTFKSSAHTIYNMVSSLVNLKILHKENKKSLTVNAQLIPDFSKPLTLVLSLNQKNWTEDTTNSTTTLPKESTS